MSTATPSPPPSGGSPSREDGAPPRGWTDVRFRPWNLLLLVPLIVIVPPLYNMTEPSIGGVPFFYWFQIAVIPVGIACTVTVHLMTRSRDEEEAAPPTGDVDALDEGTRG